MQRFALRYERPVAAAALLSETKDDAKKQRAMLSGCALGSSMTTLGRAPHAGQLPG
jgi:hypothetical protein